jgi:NADH:ubiquinone oxidoreductase subunit K
MCGFKLIATKSEYVMPSCTRFFIIVIIIIGIAAAGCLIAVTITVILYTPVHTAWLTGGTELKLSYAPPKV